MSNEIALRAVDAGAIGNLQKASQSLFQSGLYPNTKNPHGAYAIVQYGYELGIGPMMALQNINLIQGRPAASGQLMLSLAMSRGVTLHVEEESIERCAILFKRGSMEYRSEFTADDAKTAGLSGKDNWRKWPKEMLYWRAVAKGVRRIAPEAVMGLYTPDEVSSGDVVDVAPVQSVKAEIVQDDNAEGLDAIAMIRGCMTIEELQDVWKTNNRHWRTLSSFIGIEQAKDERKALLSARLADDYVDAEAQEAANA